jgi:hypothetical protein
MRKLLLAAAAALSLAMPASAQQYRFSPFHNGMGFAYGPNGQHETFVFRNGNLFANGNMNLAPPSTTGFGPPGIGGLRIPCGYAGAGC